MIPILFTPEAEPEALLDVNAIPLHDVNDEVLLAAGQSGAVRDWNTYGLGALTDCISYSVTEARNAEYELVMQYPADGVHFDEIENRCIILASANASDGPQPFRIYQIQTPINGVVTINAEHLVYDLSGVPVLPFTAQNAAAACAGLISHAAIDTPFTISTTVPTIADFSVTEPSSVRSWFGGKRGSLLDVYGGEWQYDNYEAVLRKERGQDRGVVIRYGVNLLSIQQEQNIANMWTGVLPFWKDQNGTVVRANIINIQGNFDFRRILCLDLSADFQEQPTAAQLTSRANTYIRANNIGVPKINITLDWAQSTEVVELCDTVTVEFERLGISAKAKCIKTVWDGLKERYTSIEFGDARTNIADTIHSLQQEEERAQSTVTTAMLQAIQNATALITGNEGGYVILHDTDDDGTPDEILVMDTDDITTATKVWRWNKSGLGYSASGYSGTYGLAMTQDGAIVADFITTGHLSADRISGGSIDASDVTITNLNASNISGGTITGIAINNGSGTFKVDNAGNVTANKLTSSSATITGGSININTTNSAYQAFRLGTGSASSDGYSRILPGWFEAAGLNTNYGSQIIGGLMYLGSISRNSAGNIQTMNATITLNGNGGNVRCVSLTQTSDGRLKEILEKDVPDLSGIRAVRFRWRGEGKGAERIGYIAQDVEEIAPEMVTEEEGTKALDYIQVLVAKVERLEKENDELRERLDRLEARFLDGR